MKTPPDTQSRSRKRSCLGAGALVAALSLTHAIPLRAGTTGTTALFTPQGSGTTTAQGEFVTSSGGLDVPFRYFVEVPPGTPELFVDLFDADVGAGGAAESNAQRDRARGGFNTTVTYRLLNPAGTTVSTFALGPAQNGTFDNAWTSPFGSRTFRDEFSTASYARNDGSQTWATNWIEVDSGPGPAGPTGGNVQIGGGQLALDDQPDTAPNPAPSVARQANLSSFQAAVLLFDFATTASVDATDSVVLEVSDNGGTTYVTAENFTGITGATSGSRAYNIPPAFLTANFRLRFRVNNLYGGANETFQVDNVEIRVNGRVNPTPGHWQLQIDVSTAVTGGDDIQAVGIRAHDGSPGAGGTELNVYYLSQSAFGTNPNLSRVYPVHPYVTSSCALSSNDFDMDSNGSTTHTSRTGAFTQTLPVSGNDVWLQGTVAGWTTDQVAGDYGIWDTDFTVTTDAANGNYGHLYLGSFQAAAPPPTANPEANTFRVYLPTDAGVAPAKPYLEQLLTFVSGPNPPVQGQTTRLSVTVRLVNPTPHAITFSAPTDVVTANVPGGGVTYAGNAQVSQGTLVSQPAIGGTGNVVWNPGTVAVGQTELLAYRVDVTPAAASFDLPVTGTPASNGTRSLFLDETGAQTFLFGPLCELRVQDDALTHATVSAFRVEEVAGDPAVVWSTVSEAGGAGFRVLRRDSPEAPWTPIHQGLLSRRRQSPQGATYRLADPRGPLGEDTEYLLVEVEITGRERQYGPYPGTAIASPDGLSPLTHSLTAHASPTTSPAQALETFEQWPREVPRIEETPARDVAVRAEKGLAVTAAPARRHVSGPEVLLEITETGLYRVSAERLAEVLGLRSRLVRQLILSGGLELSLQGQPVAWTLDDRTGGHADGILFYGQSVDVLFPDGQPFTDRNVYRLRLDRGPRMRTVRGRPPRSSEPGEGFRELLRLEQDVTPVTALPLDPDGDFWLWAAVNASRAAQATATFDLEVPEPSPVGTGAELTVHLQGAASTSHPVEIYADGSFLGETTWDGIAPHMVTLPLPHELLEDGDLRVEVTGIQEPGTPANQLFVDGFEIEYLRRYRVVGASVEVEAAGAREVSVTGFAQDDVQVFDISNPRAPRVLVRIAVTPDPQGDGFRVSFDTSHPLLSSEGRFLLSTPEGIREPLRIRAAGGADLDRDLGAEYLVVSPRELIEPARALADLRASRGLPSAVVALEDIYDHLAHGLADPRAVRGFLQRAVETWRTAPRWVVLVGAGTVDPRDLLGLGDTAAGRNLLTPLLISTSQGLFASDARFADFDGDGLADLAVGRLPMTDADELWAYVERLQRHEAAHRTGSGDTWTRRALLATDNPDFGGDFTTDGDRLAPLMPQDVLTRVGLETLPLASAREAVQTALRDGVSLFGWVGHSGQDRMAAEGLLTTADLPGLSLADQPPVVFALTCTLARFELPFPSLGGELLRSPEGAVAVWAPSGLSDSRDAVVLGDRFLRELFHGRPAGEPVTLGEAIRRALSELRTVGAGNATTGAMVGVYNLLGDPAIVLPLADPVSAHGTPGE